MKNADNRGMVCLLIAVSFGTLLAGTMIYLAMGLKSQGAEDGVYYREMVVRAIAESGVHKALSQLNHGDLSAAEFTLEMEQGRCLVKVEPAAEAWRISSRAMFSDKQMPYVSVEVVVKRRGEKFVITSYSEGNWHGNYEE